MIHTDVIPADPQPAAGGAHQRRPDKQQGEGQNIWKKKASCKSKKQEASQQEGDEEARGNRTKQPEPKATSESARRRN